MFSLAKKQEYELEQIAKLLSDEGHGLNEEFNDKHVAQSAFDQDDCITIFTKSVFVFANTKRLIFKRLKSRLMFKAPFSTCCIVNADVKGR